MLSLTSTTDRQSFFVNFDLNPIVSSLTSWLSGDKPNSVSLFPEEDIELTMFWISGTTLSAIAGVIALFICVCIMDIMESLSWGSLMLNSLLFPGTNLDLELYLHGHTARSYFPVSDSLWTVNLTQWHNVFLDFKQPLIVHVRYDWYFHFQVLRPCFQSQTSCPPLLTF